MRRPHVALLAAVAVVVLTGCGGGGGDSSGPTTMTPEATTSTTTVAPAPTPPPKKPALSGTARTVYDNAEGVCEAFGLTEVARQLHVSADPISVAVAVSKDYRPAFRAAAVDGCTAGLKKHG